MNKFHKVATALLLSIVMAVGGGTSCDAAITDNVANSGLELKIGEPTNTGDTVFNLLYKTISLLVGVSEQITATDAKVANLSNQLNTSTAEITQSVANLTQSATASNNLFVYIPKADAPMDYSGIEIKLYSPTRLQVATAYLKDTGTLYSATLYFNFAGWCRVCYTMPSRMGGVIYADDVNVDRYNTEIELRHPT